MKELLQGVLVILGFLLVICNGKAERLLKNGNFVERLSKKLGYDNDLGHKKNLIFLGVEKENLKNLDSNGNLAELILKNYNNNDLEHKKNSIIVLVAKEKANADSNNGTLAEILLQKSGYHKDLEQKKNLIHVNKEKPKTIINMIKPGNIVKLKDNAVYIYDRESGRFIGRSIGAFVAKMLGTFGMNDRGGILSVDTNSIDFVHEPFINNTFPGIFMGENINKIRF